ncbi:MAG: response regulator [Acidobacteriota bacterium]|jgi:two-component system cell cycle response regulator|nr:response regulator [Acidobacteriota bacterium]
MGKKVLTVDDSKTVRMIIKKHLVPFGVEVIEAENGEQGVAQAKEGRPDLILLDYNMPVMDGQHTLIELKNNPETKPIPVIMLTTETVQETVIALIKLGLKDFVAKPFTRELLLKKINPILSLYEGDTPPAPQNAGAAAQAGPAPHPGSEGKTVVLAVDDKENILKMLQEHLGEGVHVIPAMTAAEAESLMKQYQFDYLFLDLSMPDANWADIFGTYINLRKEDGSPKKVAVMTLRTAEEDINKAFGFGIQAVLYKPFTAPDAAAALGRVMAASSGKQGAWLESSGDVRILHCPGDRNPKHRTFVGALNGAVAKEIDEMAEDGQTGLIIDIGEGFLSNIATAQKFIDFINHLNKLQLNIRLVVETASAREAIKQFAETADLPTDTSMEFALKAYE